MILAEAEDEPPAWVEALSSLVPVHLILIEDRPLENSASAEQRQDLAERNTSDPVIERCSEWARAFELAAGKDFRAVIQCLPQDAGRNSNIWNLTEAYTRRNGTDLDFWLMVLADVPAGPAQDHDPVAVTRFTASGFASKLGALGPMPICVLSGWPPPERGESTAEKPALAAGPWLERAVASGAPLVWLSEQNPNRLQKLVGPDRIAPQKHVRPELTSTYAGPANETQAKLAAIWEELFGISGIGMDDHFVELGGDSMAATQMTFVIREIFRIQIPAASVFELPTIGQLADLVQSLDKNPEDLDPVNDEEQEEGEI